MLHSRIAVTCTRARLAARGRVFARSTRRARARACRRARVGDRPSCTVRAERLSLARLVLACRTRIALR